MNLLQALVSALVLSLLVQGYRDSDAKKSVIDINSQDGKQSRDADGEEPVHLVIDPEEVDVSENATISKVDGKKTDLGQSTMEQLDDEGKQEDSSEPHEAQDSSEPHEAQDEGTKEDSSEPLEAEEDENDENDPVSLIETADEDDAEEEGDSEDDETDAKEEGESEDAFNKPQDYSLINQTKQLVGAVEITVATWNILAIIKSAKDASGFIKFDLATENPGDNKAFHAAKKAFLLKVLSDHNDIDLLGLQEVDALQEEMLPDLAKSVGMKFVKGPEYDSGRGKKDCSYLLYKTSKFQGTPSCDVTSALPKKKPKDPSNFQYMRCTLKLTEALGGVTFKIVTGHSASSGIKASAPDTKEIVDFAPSVLFGDFNTDIESATKALAGLSVIGSFPATKSVNTMRKVAYIARKLSQGAAQVTEEWPDETPKTCKDLPSVQSSGACTDPNKGCGKYATRWCKEGSDENVELQEAFPGTWQTTELDKVYEGIGCLKKDCKKLTAAAAGKSKLVEGQEDAILVTENLEVFAGIVDGSGEIVGMLPTPPGEQGYPNSAWQSDHYLLKAKVRLGD